MNQTERHGESKREWNEVVAEIIEEDHDLLDALAN